MVQTDRCVTGTCREDMSRTHMTLSVRGGDRAITERGEGAGAWPSPHRSVSFDDCTLKGDFEINGRKVSETSISVRVAERSPDRPPPGTIGELNEAHTYLSLDVSPA